MKDGLKQPVLVSPDEGMILNVLGEKITCKVAYEDTGGSYSIIEEVSPPGGGPPPHLHRETDEIFFVLEGEYEIRCGEQAFVAKPGSIAALPRGIPHAVLNIGDRPGRVLVIITPGRFEHFFREIDAQNEIAEVDPPKAMEIALKHDVEFIPPNED